MNAPKGPKAMREGLPNSGIYSRPDYANAARAPTQPAMEQRAHEERESSPPPKRSERGLSPAKARSSSRSSSHQRKRKHRHRSVSISSQDDEARERRRERRRRHEERYETDRRDDHKSGETSDRHERTRSSSPKDDESRRHRRYKDKDRHRSSRSHKEHSRDERHRRHRSRSPRGDADYTNGHDEMDTESSRRKSRSHRDRDRERDRERDHKKDTDESRRHSRRDRSSPAREQDFQRRYEASRRTRQPKEDRVEPASEVADPSSDDIGFKIKGSKSAAFKAPSGPAAFVAPTGLRNNRERDQGRTREHTRERRESVQSQPTPTSIAPAIDPYAQEREARHRERVLREEQRRMSASTNKRPRDSNESAGAFDPPTGPKAGRNRGQESGSNKSRRVNYKYEDDADGEDGYAKAEAEREAGRWE